MKYSIPESHAQDGSWTVKNELKINANENDALVAEAEQILANYESYLPAEAEVVFA